MLLKDGTVALVLQTGAVNFGLLSEREQLAIIASFGQMLNSLSFPIQIVISSKKLDISSYIRLLDDAQLKQGNALLSEMIARYRLFVQQIVKENEVLDKRFYVVVDVSPLELGLGFKSEAELIKRSKNILLPRRDQLIRQLQRIGLKGSQLNNKQLFELFFEIYNRPLKEVEKKAEIKPVNLNPPQPATNRPQVSTPATAGNQAAPPVSVQNQPLKHSPFVVEELNDAE